MYRKGLNEAVFHCGNFNREDEKIKIGIDGLSDTIRTVVARYREIVHRRERTFEILGYFEKFKDGT